MNVHARLIVCALGMCLLIVFSLPPTATRADASQVATVPAGCAATAMGAAPATTDGCVLGVTPNAGSAIFDPIGTAHTATFVCDVGVISSGSGAPAGCYDVIASVQDLATGASVAIQAATCGGVSAISTAGGSVNCGSLSSPVCPVTSMPTSSGPCTAPSSGQAANLANAVQVTINPGAPHAYSITFTGYVPASGYGACPAGTTPLSGVTLHTTRPVGTVGPMTACQFSVVANEKYVEINNITVTTLTQCGGTLFFSEGFKAYFGPPCLMRGVATGMVILKSGVNCASEPPAVPAALPADFPAGATYQCAGNTLSVNNVPVSTNLTYTATGPGSFNTLNTLSNSYGPGCTGVMGVTGVTVPSGTTVTLCAVGPGAVDVQVCLAGPLTNTQPVVCTNQATPGTSAAPAAGSGSSGTGSTPSSGRGSVGPPDGTTGGSSTGTSAGSVCPSRSSCGSGSEGGWSGVPFPHPRHGRF